MSGKTRAGLAGAMATPKFQKPPFSLQYFYKFLYMAPLQKKKKKKEKPLYFLKTTFIFLIMVLSK